MLAQTCEQRSSTLPLGNLTAKHVVTVTAHCQMPQVYSGLFIKAFSREKWCSEQCEVTYRSTVKRNVLLHNIFQTNCKQNHKINNHVSIPKADKPVTIHLGKCE